MSIFTNFLNLFKWDPTTDGEEEFDINKALNENWDKIDTKLQTHITNLQNNKVDKITGKGLSTNDFDNAYKTKVDDSVRKIAFVGSDVAASSGWYKVAQQTCSGYGNTNITFMITSTYVNYNFGILELQIRSDGTSISCPTLKWLSKNGFSNSNIIVVISGMTWTLYAFQPSTQYGRLAFEILGMSNISSKDMSWALIFADNNTKESVTPTATVTSSYVAAESAVVCSGNAATSSKWATARTLSATGDATGSANIDGSANASIALTLAASGVTAGTYKSVTVDNKGRVTGGTNPTTLADYGITDATPDSHIGATGNVHGAATASVNGFMSSTDKSKLDGIATGANNYVHPTTSGNKHIPSGGSSGQILRWSADGTAVWGTDNNTTYSNATQSAAGLMSAADKTKLDSITTTGTPNNISTTEVACEKTWNGVQCYRKIITGTKVAGTALTIALPAGATNVMIEEAKLVSNSGIEYIAPFYSSASVYVSFEVNSGNLKVQGGTDSSYSAGTIYIVVRYTKT